jgi:hypothetical protein
VPLAPGIILLQQTEKEGCLERKENKEKKIWKKNYKENLKNGSGTKLGTFNRNENASDKFLEKFNIKCEWIKNLREQKCSTSSGTTLVLKQ